MLKVYFLNNCLNKIPSRRIRKFYYKKFIGIKIGHNSNIHLNLYLLSKNLTIGNNTTINQQVHLDARGEILIGDNVSISQYCKLITGSHNPDSPKFEYTQASIIVEDYVWIGTGAIILPNVRLRKGTVVMAGAVVTKDTDAYGIYGGVPAKKIRSRKSQNLDYEPIYGPIFQ